MAHFVPANLDTITHYTNFRLPFHVWVIVAKYNPKNFVKGEPVDRCEYCKCRHEIDRSWTYDGQAKALYVDVSSEVTASQCIIKGATVVLDVDAQGHLVGVEVLNVPTGVVKA